MAVIGTAQAAAAVPAGAVDGAFRVSESRYVNFAKGNLQYTTSTGTYSFAEHQYDRLGTANITTDTEGNKVPADKVDLFTWRTYQSPKQGGGLMQSLDAYTDTVFYEWGFEKISNDGLNQHSQWRTLSDKEWQYLFLHNRWTIAEIDGMGIFGLMLIPEGAVLPADITVGLLSEGNLTETMKTYTRADYAMNLYMPDDFQRLEAAGAVFLPFAGTCDAKGKTDNLTTGGYYWSSTYVGGMKAAYDIVFSQTASFPFFSSLNIGQSVRLVRNCYPAIDPDMEERKPLAGVFDIGNGKQIRFSCGNLQYTTQGEHSCADGTTQKGTWRFAPAQYETRGEDNLLAGESFEGWTDLFGWGTSGWSGGITACEPWSTDKNNNRYHAGGDYRQNLTDNYANADWGVYNAIANGGNNPQQWRTLTQQEWQYLLNHARWTRCTIQTAGEPVSGLLLMPADSLLPEGITLAMQHTYATGNVQRLTYDTAEDNVLTTEQLAQLETHGAVFLPNTGVRSSEKRDKLYDITQGKYWSSTAFNNKEDAQFILSTGSGVYCAERWHRSNGYAVRLVQDYEDTTSVQEVAPVAGHYAVADGEYVQFAGGNLQYMRSNGRMFFAEKQYECIGLDNVTDIVPYEDNSGGEGKGYANRIDLFGWSTRVSNYGTVISDKAEDFSDYFVDWGRQAVYNGGNKSDEWHTLRIEEWEYVLTHHAWTIVHLTAGEQEIAGLMLFPGNFAGYDALQWNILSKPNAPADLSFSPSDHVDNTCSLSTFEELEKQGAVFLPFAGSRTGLWMSSVNSMGYYWSSSYKSDSETYARGMLCSRKDVNISGFTSRGEACSVRLVKTATPPETGIRNVTSDTATVRKVLRNGQVLIERVGKTYTLTGVEAK